MTQASLRPPSNLQPRPKAVPTFSSTSIAATTTTPQTSRPSSKSRQSSPARPHASHDTSERATVALIRRVLCPHNHGATDSRPVHELLPPLTSSNDIDFQLYAIIAIVVKDLVQSWYGKITPDQDFVEEIVRIVAHCTTQLESRLRTVDLESLFFDEIPRLVADHIHGRYITSYGQACQLMLPDSLQTQSPAAAYTALHQSPGDIPQSHPSPSILPCARLFGPWINYRAKRT